MGWYDECRSLTFVRFALTKRQIVPVIPFALPDRVGIPHDRGDTLFIQSFGRRADGSQVQSWTSILLATFGSALVVVSGRA